MKKIRVPEVHAVSARAKQVYGLAMSPDCREGEEKHDELTRAVDSLLLSCEALFGSVRRLGIEFADNGQALAVEGLDLGGVVGDMRAAKIAIDSASLHWGWKYPGFSRKPQQEERGEFSVVGLRTLRKDVNDFLDQLVRSEKIMHDHREILRELAR